MSTSLKLLLLDADVVITAYKVGVWDLLIDTAEVSIAETVAHTEALFHRKKGDAFDIPIDLPRLVQEGRVHSVSASLEEILQDIASHDRPRDKLRKETHIQCDVEQRSPGRQR